MTQHAFTAPNPAELLDQVRAAREVARRPRPYAARRSKLERHRATIRALHERGASLGDIQVYLRTLASPRVDVERSTVLRYVRSLGLRR